MSCVNKNFTAEPGKEAEMTCLLDEVQTLLGKIR